MDEKRFVRTYKQGIADITEIWADRKTGVNYVFHASGYAGGLTPPAGPGGEAGGDHSDGGVSV